MKNTQQKLGIFHGGACGLGAKKCGSVEGFFRALFSSPFKPGGLG